MALTQSQRDHILNHLFRNIPMNSPTTVYVGLFNGSTEVSGGGYARQQVTFGSPVNGVMKNSQSIHFPIATADWGNVTTAAIFDEPTGGTRIADGRGLSPQTVEANQQFIIPIGNLTVSLIPKE